MSTLDAVRNATTIRLYQEMPGAKLPPLDPERGYLWDEVEGTEEWGFCATIAVMLHPAVSANEEKILRGALANAAANLRMTRAYFTPEGDRDYDSGDEHVEAALMHITAALDPLGPVEWPSARTTTEQHAGNCSTYHGRPCSCGLDYTRRMTP